MEQFNNVVEHLDVSCIVIIENDLKPENNAEAILAKYSILSSVNKVKLLEKLTNKGFSNLLEKLTSFDAAFSSLPHTEQKLAFLSTGELTSYLRSLKGAQDITTLCNETKAEVEKESSVNTIFFQYGITSTELPVYKPFVDQIFEKSDYKPCILLFQDVTSTSYKEFEADLKNAMHGTTNSFIAIVDKMLGNGEPNGLKIANEYITTISKENKLKPYPFILTSTATDEPEKLEDYNLLVVSKQSQTLIEDMCKTISINAYSKIFQFFQKTISDSLAKAAETASKNRNNIAYIVNKANEEGMLPYEAILIWFENALNLYTNAAIYSDGNLGFTSTIGLSKLISKVNDDEENLLNDFKSHLKELNTNEIFDYSINVKHLPVAPGDVFTSNEGYFVLIGQACDLSLRSDLKRGSKLAKIITASFEVPGAGKKYKAKVIKDNPEYIKLNFFRNEKQEIGFLKIELPAKKTLYLDFPVLDLCMYNSDGKGTIDISKQLEKPLKNYFAEVYVAHYTNLQEEIKKIVEIPEEIKTLLKEKTNSLFTYDKTDDVITFPFQRICRIRGNFNHLIHHNYWHYRSRTDLNEINLTEE